MVSVAEIGPAALRKLVLPLPKAFILYALGRETKAEAMAVSER